jgi:DNA excision repair protein ERCC-2
VIQQCGDPKQSKPHQIRPPVELFFEQDQKLKAFLSQYLATDVEIKPKDVVLRLSYYWSEFTFNLQYVRLDAESGMNRFFTTYNPQQASVKITCCDASDLMKKAYEEYANVTGFSATLKPFDYYSQLCGLKSPNLKTAEFASPFEKKNRKILLIPQISSKYSERERNYPRIAEVIHKISRVKLGNYVAFFPSFEFMNRVFNQFQPPAGVLVLKQEKSMLREDVDATLEQLKASSQAHILFAVQGGVFSEGVDYPGEMLIGAFVVGPPLPNFDLEREKMREYYELNYSSGFDYAYTYPAMAKAVQAAGRVIRTERDKGIIVLMDNRFVQHSYVKSMPQDWFEFEATELISQQILRDVENFWSSSSPEEQQTIF